MFAGSESSNVSPAKTLEFFKRSSDFVINGGVFNNIGRDSTIALASALTLPKKSREINVDGLSTSDHYTLMMLPQNKGYPVWDPLLDNNLPEEYRKEGVRIGDVGILNGDGGFDFLFNVCRPADHPINRGRVPDEFKPIDTIIDAYDQPRCYPLAHSISSSDSGIHRCKIPRTNDHQRDISPEDATVAGLRFTATIPSGAVLILPEGGSRTYAHNNLDFLDYVKLHAVKWYKHVHGRLRREIGSSSLYLVTGCDKTRYWGSAVFSRCEPKDVDLSFVHLGGERQPPEYDFDSSRGCTTHRGSNNINSSPPPFPLPMNGCVFMKGFKIAVKSSLWRPTRTEVLSLADCSPNDILDRGPPFRLRGGADSDDDSDDPDSHLFSTITAFIPETRNVECLFHRLAKRVILMDIPLQPFHPADIIHDCVLKAFDFVDMIVTHDDQWFPFLLDLYDPDDLQGTGPLTFEPTEFLKSLWSKFKMNWDDELNAASWEENQLLNSDIREVPSISTTLSDTSPTDKADSASGRTSSTWHRGIWSAKVYVDGTLRGTGTGITKGGALDAAASLALHSIMSREVGGGIKHPRVQLNNWAQSVGYAVTYECSQNDAFF